MKGRAKMKVPAAPNFWPLVDLFRTETGVGWELESVKFGRRATNQIGGRKWNVTFSIGSGLFRKVEALVTVSGFRPKVQGARAQLEHLAAAESIERKLRRAGYRGEFKLDFDRSFYGYFRKRLAGAGSVRGEIGRLGSLRLGGRKQK